MDLKKKNTNCIVFILILFLKMKLSSSLWLQLMFKYNIYQKMHFLKKSFISLYQKFISTKKNSLTYKKKKPQPFSKKVRHLVLQEIYRQKWKTSWMLCKPRWCWDILRHLGSLIYIVRTFCNTKNVSTFS